MHRPAALREQAKQIRNIAAESESDPAVYYKLLTLATECETVADSLSRRQEKKVARASLMWR